MEDDLERSVENLVQSLFLLGGAHDEALEGVLLGGGLDLGVAHAVAQLGLVSGALELLTQVQLRADEDARAGSRRRLDLADPLLARVLQ